MMCIVMTQKQRPTAVRAVLLVVMFFIAGFSASGDGNRSVPARAVELSGTVLVNYSGEDQWRNLFRMEGVRDADRVFTGPDGEVSLKCKDDTLITLFPRGEMEIEELSLAVQDGEDTAVTALILSRGRVDITTGVSDRYGSDLTLTASNVRLESSGSGRNLVVMVEYVPEIETIGILWHGGEGAVTVPADYPGVVEVTFTDGTAGNVSFSREGASDSGVDTLAMRVSMQPMDSSIDAVIDHIVIRGGGRVMLSGRTAGIGISIFTDEEGTTPVDSEGGFWATKFVVDAGDSFSPELTALGPPGDMPCPPAVRDGAETFRGSEKRTDSSVDEQAKPLEEEKDASRIARLFLEDFIGAVETGDVTTLSGLIDPSYSGIGATRSGLLSLVREYFDDADTLRITWSVVRIDETEDAIVATISWSSSAGTSGVSAFWLSDTRRTRLSHAEGDWFF